MEYNNVILRVIDPANISTVAKLLQEQARVSLTEPGCERFEVYHSQSDAQTFAHGVVDYARASRRPPQQQKFC